MTEQEDKINKIKWILREISIKNKEDDLLELLNHSSFIFEEHWNNPTFPNMYNLLIQATPLIYTKNYNNLNEIKCIIKRRINDSTPLKIEIINVNPDYDKIMLLNSEILVVQTEWEQINENQSKLIECLKVSQHPLEYQNIGNISRTIINKLAKSVFNSEIHKPVNSKIAVDNSKFKNQLHTYIAHVLSGKENEELRKFAISAIDFTEKAIDLMNTTTHKLEAQKHFAEVCVISTISVVSLIKVIFEIEKNQKINLL